MVITAAASFWTLGERKWNSEDNGTFQTCFEALFKADHVHVTTSPLNGLGGKNALPCQKDSNPNAPTPWWTAALEMEWRKWCTKHTEVTYLNETWLIHQISILKELNWISSICSNSSSVGSPSCSAMLIQQDRGYTNEWVYESRMKIGKHLTLGIQIWSLKLLSCKLSFPLCHEQA